MEFDGSDDLEDAILLPNPLAFEATIASSIATADGVVFRFDDVSLALVIGTMVFFLTIFVTLWSFETFTALKGFSFFCSIGVLAKTTSD